jgi:PAS domain S-box-containing protein
MPDTELSILYVDDEVMLLEVTGIYLTDMGFRVDTAESGEEALTKIREIRYDAIVSDYQMPDMDGITLLKEIRKEFPDIPFILFTGRGREEVVIQAIESGADFYLQKGGSPRPQYTELSHKIRSAVQQRRAGISLRESHERFNQVADNAGEWIWEIDETGLFRYCSSAVEQILGYTSEELVGQKCFFDLYDQSVLEKQKQAAFEIIRGMQNIRNQVFYYLHKNGDRIILQVSGSPISGEDGSFIGYRGIHLDVTAQKKNEELIRLHEKRLVRAQKIGKTGNWEYNFNTRLLWGSEGALRIFGYHRPAGDITLEEIESCIIEREQVHQVLMDLITNGTPYNLEYTINPADGFQPKIINSIAHIEPDDQGGMKVIGVIQDITERKKAEQEIQRMNEDISTAYEELASNEEELRVNYDMLANKQQELSESEELLRLKLGRILSPDYDVSEEEFGNIINSADIQSVMDDFYALTEMGIGIIDLKGNVLVATGWQDICTRFHRVHPETLKNCIESDLFLSSGTEAGESRAYKCKNHLWDIVTPIIVGDKHMGNLFLGQFFFDDETPDYEVFTDQAKKYGFDPDEYLAALDRVPHWSKERVERVLSFYAKFAEIISRLSYSNLKLAKTLTDYQNIVTELSLSDEKYRAYIENSPQGITVTSADEIFLIANPALCLMLGYSQEEIGGCTMTQIFPDPLCRYLNGQSFENPASYAEEFYILKSDGALLPVSVSAQRLPDQSVIAFIIDICELKHSQEMQAKATRQIEDNIHQMAALNDQIRNPLTIIFSLCDMDQMPHFSEIETQIQIINDIIKKIDQGWVESLKIRHYLKRHYDISIPDSQNTL